MTWDRLLTVIRDLRAGEVGGIVHSRLAQFQAFQSRPPAEVFQELAFCILTANCRAKQCLSIQEALGTQVITASPEDLFRLLQAHHYRFPPRARHIVAARQYKDCLMPTLHSLQGEQRRRWLTDHIGGLGDKEASHFLRNVGFFDYAIVDAHILDLLDCEGIATRPRTLTFKRYREIESRLRELADVVPCSLGELDLLLWYLETGTILK